MSRFTRKAALALAAMAALTTLACATNEASARAFGGPGVRSGGGVHMAGHGMRHVGGVGIRRIGGIKHPQFKHPHVHPKFVQHHHRHWRWGWRRHYWVAPVVTTAVATGVVAAAPTWNRCSCLTKEYTPEGAVVFKDLCTKETAVNPPAVHPTAYDPAQDPAVGALQPSLQPTAAVTQVR